jgi:predicted RNase H-like HicB family nuclease
MKRSFTASISQEGEWYIAQCMQVDVASQGATEDEALENLRDALELHFTPPVATITPRVRDIEVDIRAA